jgi:catecholate siderophore receptor
MAASLALGLGLPVSVAAAEIELAPPATIVVTGQRDGATGLDRLPVPLLDTPQAIEVITAADLQVRGISNLNDALRGVAGLSLGAGETSFQGNNAILRGFTTRNDLYVDNARDYGYYYRDTFNDQGVEVIKGPSSTLFGRGSTGGVIHRTSKAPLAEDRFAAEAQLGSDDTRRLAIDANVVAVAGAGSALRINAVVHHSAVAGRDSGYFERWGLAPVLVLGLGSPTRLILSYLHQQEANRPDYGIPWISGSRAAPGYPAPVARANYYGFSNDRLHTDVNILTARLAHDVSAQTQLRGQARYSNNSRDFRYSEAVIPAGTARSAPLDSISIGRNLFQGASRDRFFQVQAEGETRLQLWPGAHHIIAGAEAGTEATDPTYITNTNVPRTSLVAPVGGFYDSAPGSFVRLRGRARSQFVGVFGIDSIDISPHWQLLVGLRWDRFATR